MMTLHEAIKQILLENDNRGLTANEIAELNERQQLYRKKDDNFPGPAQIHARVRKRPQMFRKEEVSGSNQLIYLK